MFSRPTAHRNRGLLARVLVSASPQDPFTSLTAHIHALLNTRRGESYACPSMGLVDFADVVHRFPSSTEALMLDMKVMLETYEPRLSDIKVTAVECNDPLRIAFEISAKLTTDGGRPIHLLTELSPSGRFDPPTPKRP